MDFAPPRCGYTHSFARYALELSRLMTLKDVARHLGVPWDLVKSLQKDYLRKHFAKPKLRHLRRIAVDEIAVAKGHVYNTVVLDLDSGAIVYVGQGRGADALDRRRKQAVRHLAIEVDDQRLHLILDAAGDVDQEMKAFLDKGALLGTLLDRRIEVTVV